MPIADAFDAHEINELLAILRLRENHDRPDLRNRLGQDGGRKRRPLPRTVREVTLVERHVLDADDPFVWLELGDPVHEQERIPVRQNAFDGGVIQREGQVHG